MELWLGIFSSACSAIIVAMLPKIFKGMSETKCKVDATNAAVLSYLRSKILDKCKQWQAEGYLPDDEAYALQEMYRNYKALGGNHHVDKQVEKTLELPLTKE